MKLCRLSLIHIYKITFERIEKGLIIKGCPEVYNNKENLIYKSFVVTAENLGKKVDGLKISIDAKIDVYKRQLNASKAKDKHLNVDKSGFSNVKLPMSVKDRLL